MTAHDPAMIKSAFARNPRDSYYTERAVTEAIARRIPDGIKTIWEPACGRGDMARVLRDHSFNVLCSDIHIDPNGGLEEACAEQFDFLNPQEQPWPEFYLLNDIDAIITNPPFGDDAEKFIRRALSYKDIRYFAFVLRSEWKHGKSRLDLFTEEPYAGEIVLTWRPRWDWWLTDDEKRAKKIEAGKDPDVSNSPRHNYSVLVWDREHKGLPWQQFATRDK